MTVPQEIEAGLPEMIAWRRAFHRVPELAYEEHRTAATVVELLRTFGIDEIATGIGGTGVVGILRNGDGPRVALRADMDALPIAETGTPAWRSEIAGKMHACGHDGHMSMLLGAARYLAATRRFAGTVVLIFQPAEEGRAGAKAMIEDGLLDRFPFDRVFGLHNIPGMAAAEIAASAGPVMAAVDKFDIVVTGKGGHAAMPHLNRDPVLAAAALVVALQSIVSRDRDPARPAVVTVTRFNAGEADNATPDRAALRGNVRFLETGGSEIFRDHIERIARGVANTYGVAVDVDYAVGRPATVNAEAEARLAREVAATLAPDATLAARQAPIMASEDFSYFLEARPGAFAFLGAGEGRPSLHSSDYDFNDAILVPGAAFLARLAEHALLR
ncbi:MAG TPA: amidohydrolase [Bauldia sp.]|nr:amidohydrolase [Bauldia sp.]